MHVHDDVNPHSLRILEGIFSLGAAQWVFKNVVVLMANKNDISPLSVGRKCVLNIRTGKKDGHFG